MLCPASVLGDAASDQAGSLPLRSLTRAVEAVIPFTLTKEGSEAAFWPDGAAQVEDRAFRSTVSRAREI
jgi:hypothetical protein